LTCTAIVLSSRQRELSPLHGHIAAALQRFHDQFTTISRRIYSDFPASLQRFHENFSAISRRVYSGFPASLQ
jgi:hypothetical protein